MIAMARIIVFPRTANFFSFFILQRSFDKLDNFDHNQASSVQEKESLKKLIQGWTVMQLFFHSLKYENSTLLPLLTPYLVLNDYIQPLFVFSVLARGENTKAFNILRGYVLFSCTDINSLSSPSLRLCSHHTGYFFTPARKPYWTGLLIVYYVGN